MIIINKNQKDGWRVGSTAFGRTKLRSTTTRVALHPQAVSSRMYQPLQTSDQSPAFDSKIDSPT
jgi:hypothetical protein